MKGRMANQVQELLQLVFFSTILFSQLPTVRGDSVAMTGKEAQQCLQLGNATSFAVGEHSLSVKPLCNMAFPYTEVLQITYVQTFDDCLNLCETYQGAWPCFGIHFENSTSGPEQIGGSMCWLLWNTTVGPTANDQADSAIINLNQTWDPTICNSSSPYKTSTGDSYQLFCGGDFHSSDLHQVYVRDLYECMELCSAWNTNASNVPCQGTTIDVGTYGPSQKLGGSRCILKWDTSEAPDYGGHPTDNTIAVHSARLLSRGTSAQPASTSSGGVSKGAVAGIAVGLFIAGVLAGVAGSYIYNRLTAGPGRPPSQSQEVQANGDYVADPSLDRVEMRTTSSSFVPDDEKRPWRQRPAESQIDH